MKLRNPRVKDRRILLYGAAAWCLIALALGLLSLLPHGGTLIFINRTGDAYEVRSDAALYQFYLPAEGYAPVKLYPEDMNLTLKNKATGRVRLIHLTREYIRAGAIDRYADGYVVELNLETSSRTGR